MEPHAQQTSQKVGIREFRDNLARYVECTDPIAITRHGETIGYYIPTRQRPTQEDLNALVIASQKMQKMMEKAGVTEDEIIEDFKHLRRSEQET